jgi:hypothetical protein
MFNSLFSLRILGEKQEKNNNSPPFFFPVEPAIIKRGKS